MSWGYQHNGPSVWSLNYPIASQGQHQSPINIQTDKIEICNQVNHMISMSYPSSIRNAKLENTGYGWKVKLPDNISDQTVITGGPLGDHKYHLVQFHCHWGPTSELGSEHQVDGQCYSAELHFVHWNKSLYESPSEASKSDNGLAVIGIFLKVGNEFNYELQKLNDKMDAIKYKGQSVDIQDELLFDNLLPKNKAFWSYGGSLTTPPLHESVTWIVFVEPIQCTDDQLSQFRKLCYTQSDDPIEGRLIHNYRPVQPINNRIIKLYSQ